MYNLLSYAKLGFCSLWMRRWSQRHPTATWRADVYRQAAKCVLDIVGHPVEPNVEAIDQTLDDYLTEHEDNDTWYSFHEFIEDVEWYHYNEKAAIAAFFFT